MDRKHVPQSTLKKQCSQSMKGVPEVAETEELRSSLQLIDCLEAAILKLHQQLGSPCLHTTDLRHVDRKCISVSVGSTG